MSTPSVDPADEAMLLRLGRVAESVDPAPAIVYEVGRAAFAMRRLDAELAELVGDSALETAGVRGDGQARLLTFQAGELLIELQVTPSGDHCGVLGQVVPPPSSGGFVRLEVQAGVALSAGLDDAGGFRFDDVPLGLVRFQVELPAAAAVTTTWVSL
jgi:hypothetical protein